MPSPQNIFDTQAAYGAIREWLTAVYGPGGLAQDALAEQNIYQGWANAPRTTPAQGKVVMQATTPSPVTEGFRSDRVDTAEQQVITVTVNSAETGNYALDILGQTTLPYPAVVPPDTETDIAAALASEVDALALPVVTTAGPNAGQFQITGDNAGQHLGVGINAEPSADALTLAIETDTICRTSVKRGYWVISLFFDDIGPNSDTIAAASMRRAKQVQTYMEENSSLLTPGSQTQMLGDILRDAGLAYNVIVTDRVIEGSFQDGRLWVRRARVDVRFTTQTGLIHDVPNIATFGSVAQQIQAQV